MSAKVRDRSGSVGIAAALESFGQGLDAADEQDGDWRALCGKEAAADG